MLVKNVKGFPAVYNALMTFKALPKNILIALTGISENEFQKMLRSHTIYKQTGDSYALVPSATASKELVKAASFFVNFRSTSNIMLVGRMPTTFVFTIDSATEGPKLAKLCFPTVQTASVLKPMMSSDIDVLFCMFENPDMIAKLPPSTEDCIVYYVKLVDYDEETNLPNLTLTRVV